MAEEMTKRERVLAALRGQEVDRPPVSMWRHFFESEATWRGLVEAMLAFQRRFQWDFVKVNPRAHYHVEDWGVRYRYGSDSPQRPYMVQAVVERPQDWERIEPRDIRKGVLAEHLEALRHIARGLGENTPFVMTVFTPLSVAAGLMANAQELPTHLHEEPQRVHQALEAITQTFEEFAWECMNAGASGLFLATTAWASYNSLDDQQYAEFGRPYDLRILAAAPGADFHLLHVCRGRNMLASLKDYPVHAFNWDDQDPTNVSLKEGQQLTGKTVIGGVDRRGVLLKGSPAEVEAQVKAAIAQTGGRGMMVGPGCTFPPEAPQENLVAVRRAVTPSPARQV